MLLPFHERMSGLITALLLLKLLLPDCDIVDSVNCFTVEECVQLLLYINLKAAFVDLQQVFAEPMHMLNDRKIDPKKALARGGRDPIKKVFVGGLSPEFPLDEIKEYFGKFGKVG